MSLRPVRFSMCASVASGLRWSCRVAAACVDAAESSSWLLPRSSLTPLPLLTARATPPPLPVTAVECEPFEPFEGGPVPVR